MADFCKQCSIDMFGKDFKELANCVTEEQFKNEGLMATVLCEGCGAIQVDHEGNCLSEDCGGDHRHPPQPGDEIEL
jgi:hypothetical protein